MGVYVNPGNEGFASILRDRYIDKTGLIAILNSFLETPRRLACVSRPRRFGKSFAAQSLVAYYSCGCDSSSLFDGLAVSQCESYRAHLNAYNVIRLDMSAFGGNSDGDVVREVIGRLLADLRREFPGIALEDQVDLALLEIVRATGRKFIFVIDEWDAPMRDASIDTAAQERYLKFLRLLFKNASFTPEAVAGAYMTGILPIKKDGSQSAISDFYEYTTIDPGPFAGFLGFTEEEVRGLCKEFGREFAETRRWYDGYSFGDARSLYNPSSVMRAMRSGVYASYWTQTAAADSLMTYIQMDFEGMLKSVASLLGGDEVAFDTNGFDNDFRTFHSRDDVLTLLVHLGYLTRNPDTGFACVPNDEVRLEFARAVNRDDRSETVARVQASRKIIEDTVAMNAAAVAEGIQAIHDKETTPLFYNNEQSLRSVVKLAYFCYRDNNLQMEELPSGTGFADIAYLPKKGSPYPALVVELKWNADAEGAIAQIRRKRYPAALEGFGGDILLVGISYDKDAATGNRTHTCAIEKA